MKVARITFLMIFLTCFLSGALCQKKEMNEARDLLKSGKDLSKAQTTLESLLKTPENRDNEKIYGLLFDILAKQYAQANEKLYLKQNSDTASLFNLTKRLFEVAETLDSLEMKPDKNGKVRFKYRTDHREYLHLIRPNLYNGGLWLIGKQKYPEGYEYLDAYIDCARQPLFKSKNYQERDPQLSEAAYWSVYCGYKMKDPKATLHHSYQALKDTLHYNYMLQYLAETYKLENDTARYEQTLLEGFKLAPKFPFFFPRLIELYTDNDDLDAAMTITNQALTADSTNLLFQFTKTTLLLNLGEYDECINLCDKMLEQNDSLAGLYLNAGLSYYYKATKLDKNLQQSTKTKKEIQSNYQKAMPYLEKYKAMHPEETDRWAFPLYTIYLNLNKGTEFDEMEKIMKKQTANKKKQ